MRSVSNDKRAANIYCFCNKILYCHGRLALWGARTWALMANRRFRNRFAQVKLNFSTSRFSGNVPITTSCPLKCVLTFHKISAQLLLSFIVILLFFSQGFCREFQTHKRLKAYSISMIRLFLDAYLGEKTSTKINLHISLKNKIINLSAEMISDLLFCIRVIFICL